MLPNKLKQKSGPLQREISDDMLKNIEASIQAMSEEFLEAIGQQIDELMPLFQNIKSEKKGMDDLFTKAHDIKGQAGTFGYPLITYVSNELCRFLEKIKAPYSEQSLHVVLAHIHTMNALFKNKVTGNGSDVEEKILDGLEKAVEQTLNNQ